MEVYIDLDKAVLNTSKLVRKPVQVRGKNGKIFTRMMWVDPNKDQPAPIKSKAPQPTTEKKPIHHTPDPEPLHHPIADKPKDKPMKVSTPQIQSEPKFVSGFKDSLTSVDLSGNSEDNLYSIVSHIEDNEYTDKIKSHLSKMINSTDISPSAKKIKKYVLRTLDTGEVSFLAAHPGIAKAIVDHLLGEVVANDLRNRLGNGFISVNTDHRNIDDIMKNGFRGASATYNSDNPIVSEAVVLPDSSDSDRGEYMEERAMVENSMFGITDKSDTHPVYLCYNPKGSAEGALPEYGSAVLKMDNKALHNCTGSYTDSFLAGSAVPHFHDMDHLVNAFIIKHLNDQNNTIDGIMNTEYNGENMPYEIHHHGAISPDHLQVTNRGGTL